jgi:hypothetical protein
MQVVMLLFYCYSNFKLDFDSLCRYANFPEWASGLFCYTVLKIRRKRLSAFSTLRLAPGTTYYLHLASESLKRAREKEKERVGLALSA